MDLSDIDDMIKSVSNLTGPNNDIKPRRAQINMPEDPVRSASSSDNIQMNQNSIPKNINMDDVNAVLMGQLGPGQRSVQINTKNQMPRMGGQQNALSLAAAQKRLQSMQAKRQNTNNNASAPQQAGQVAQQDASTVGGGNDGNNTGNNAVQVSDNADGGDNNGAVELAGGVPDHITKIMGYSIPTSTLYFLAVLVVIAVILYFLTKEKEKPKKKKEKDED